MRDDRSLKRLRKKAKRGMRGWPVATIAFYGPNLNQATKVAVSVVPAENAEPTEMRDWNVDFGDIRTDPGVAFNLARNWAHWGRAATPGVGVMVVWSHHVGKITGRTADGQWIVTSGNDGHAVRTRPRSLAGAMSRRCRRGARWHSDGQHRPLALPR